MMPVRQHLAYPYTITIAGQTMLVEQGSDQEIGQCMAIILSWPLGTREGNPDFGVDEQAFLDGGANVDEIRQALQVNEPRALTDIVADDSRLAQFVETVRVGYTANTQQPTQ